MTKTNGVKLEIEIKDAGLCPRYQAVVLDLPDTPPTNYLLPMQTFIARSGTRSIDRVVDITNELMLLTGQPLHAFDHDKLVAVGLDRRADKSARDDVIARSGATKQSNAAKIIVRAAKKGEKLELLDGKTIEMDEKDIVITSNNVPVALAGAMGGANTAIDKNTCRIVIESATFNLYNLRGTQFRHGIFSEAITRFTKEQPPALTDLVIKKAIEVYGKYCGAKQISDIIDAYPKKVANKPIEISVEQINNLLGSAYSMDDVITTLTNIGYVVKITTDKLKVTAPWWRTDIHIVEDVIEDIGRINGFDDIPLKLPLRPSKSVAPDKLGDLKSKIRQILAESGANEVLTYSFVSEKLLKKAGQDPKNSYKIVNSISPELQYVRQRIVPSLLEKAYENLRAGYDKFALFEMNQVFWKSEGLNDEKVPVQLDNLGFVVVDSEQKDTNYYLAKKYIDELAAKLGVKIRLVPRDKPFDVEAYFEPKRAVDLFIGDQYVGNIAEIKNSVLTKFKLPRGTAAIEMGVDLILGAIGENQTKHTSAISKFPSVERDITFRVSNKIEHAKIENFICRTLEKQGLQFQLVTTSIFQKGLDFATAKAAQNDMRNVSFRLKFASFEKTLNGAEIAGIMDGIASEVKKELKGEVI
ncbi:hypothetical protein FACS189431_1720 [Alphaproteobacteria bacterium]|nr:hypothetical protein FACS189431_1720 [Alphaproteobacteria bacterium]